MEFPGKYMIESLTVFCPGNASHVKKSGHNITLHCFCVLVKNRCFKNERAGLSS